jgi:hypothetical protein
MTEDTIKNLIKLTRDVDTSGNLTNDGLTVAYASNTYAASTFAGNTYAASTFAGNTYAASTFTSNAFFQDNKGSGPEITSAHPIQNIDYGDTIYLVGTGFSEQANVMLISNSGIETVVGNVTFNTTSNVVFQMPSTPEGQFGEPYRIRITSGDLGTSNTTTKQLNLANNSVQFPGKTQGFVTAAVGIHKFSFSSGSTIFAEPTESDGLTNITDNYNGGTSSEAHGYNTNITSPSEPRHTVLRKFQFSTFNFSSNIGNLSVARNFGGAGQSSKSEGFGYHSGGLDVPGVASNVIDKHSFSTDGNATDVGDLTIARNETTGQSSPTHGYTSGGNQQPGNSNIIDKFPFASSGNASDVGDLTVARKYGAGTSSTTHGYYSGGSSPNSNIIEKFSLSSDGNAADVGALTGTFKGGVGVSSVDHGYHCGSANQPTASLEVTKMNRFPFASDTNATEMSQTFGGISYGSMKKAFRAFTGQSASSPYIGDMEVDARGFCSGHQV